MRRIEISVPDDAAAAMQYQADCRLITLHDFIRLAVASYIDKYPSKGTMAHIIDMRSTDPTFVGSDGNPENLTKLPE